MQRGVDLGSEAITLYNEILWNVQTIAINSTANHLYFFCVIYYYQGFDIKLAGLFYGSLILSLLRALLKSSRSETMGPKRCVYVWDYLDIWPAVVLG